MQRLGYGGKFNELFPARFFFFFNNGGQLARTSSTLLGQGSILTIAKRQSAVVWTCLPFIGSGQNHLARHSERGKKTKHTEKEAGRQHKGTDRPGVREVPEGSGELRKMEETGYEIFCGAPMALAVKG